MGEIEKGENFLTGKNHMHCPKNPSLVRNFFGHNKTCY